MNFQALLFCQDEKTARVTTQLLNELEFSVETASEPFAAVKKLMGQHFDAVVVDCDNEQNASLLFKGARNSTLNQSSLAVAVVEGQAGVANAFRIGANLVLTKPINIEQAKGTLRVARGLLKKGGETAKASPASPAPTAPAVGPTSITPTQTAPPIRPAAADAVAKPVFTPPPVRPLAATAVAKSKVDAGDIFEVETGATEPANELFLDSLEEPKPAAKADAKPASLLAAAESRAAKEPPRVAAAPVLSSSGAASAPAPAKARALPEFEKIGDPITPAQPHAAAAPSSASMEAPGLFSQRQSAPTFGSLEMTDEASSGGAGKFVMMAVVLVALAAAGYFGYTKFLKHAAAAPTQSQQESPAAAPELPPTVASAPSAIVTATPVAPKPSAAPAAPNSSHTAPAETATPGAHKNDTAKAAEAEPEVVVTHVEPAPRIVKANPVKPGTSAKSNSNDADVDAPSALEAAPGDSSQISKIVSSAPVSVPSPSGPQQMLKVSQGVTQGLLLKRVQPIYPHQAMQMRIQGAVQLLAVINKSGSISSVKVLSGDPILSRAAVEAVNQWKYKPYTLDGEPVDIQTQITVNFRLP